MKKTILKTGILTILLFCVWSICGFAEENAVPQAVINGVYAEFDVPPVIEEGRMLVPIRVISEQLEYEVFWDAEKSRVEIRNDGETLELFIGKKEYLENGTKKEMDVPARLTNGRTLVPIRLVSEEFGCTVRWIEERKTAEIVKYETVNVRTAKELLEKIGSYKRIVLAEGEYNLSEVKERAANDFIGETDWGDGTEYSVLGANDLIIEGEEGKKVTVLIEPRYANVLAFGKCEHITLKNLTMGHSEAPGYCVGGVVSLEGCDYVNMENLHLFGCGTVGVKADMCTYVNVKDTEIYECTYGFVEATYSGEIAFDNCVFRDTEGYDMFFIQYCSGFKVKNSIIKNSKSGIYFRIVSAYDSVDVCFDNCDFDENAYFEFATEDVIFENCRNNNHTI